MNPNLLAYYGEKDCLMDQNISIFTDPPTSTFKIPSEQNKNKLNVKNYNSEQQGMLQQDIYGKYFMNLQNEKFTQDSLSSTQSSSIVGDTDKPKMILFNNSFFYNDLRNPLLLHDTYTIRSTTPTVSLERRLYESEKSFKNIDYESLVTENFQITHDPFLYQCARSNVDIVCGSYAMQYGDKIGYSSCSYIIVLSNLVFTAYCRAGVNASISCLQLKVKFYFIYEL
uniref:Astacin domain-containing protein n=1 Tax=Strongyloides papillosus TaxID=174720 RepID=A0A0N5BU26_STREA